MREAARTLVVGELGERVGGRQEYEVVWRVFETDVDEAEFVAGGAVALLDLDGVYGRIGAEV
jgi:hypothetical protein